MPYADSLVTIHMAASLDGFIALKDGTVDWMATSDVFPGGEAMPPDAVDDFFESSTSATKCEDAAARWAMIHGR